MSRKYFLDRQTCREILIAKFIRYSMNQELKEQSGSLPQEEIIPAKPTQELSRHKLKRSKKPEAKLISLSKLKNRFLSHSQFSGKYPNYPAHSFFLSKIYSDLVLTNELDNVEVLDGENLQFEMYYFIGTFTKNNKSGIRIMIPIPVDSEIDLLWYTDIRCCVFSP
jgi:hypothetical protein